MPVRRVRRVVRKIDPWTVLKVSLVFNAIAGLVTVLGLWVFWSIVVQQGIPDRVTETLGKLTIELTFDGQLYFRIVVLLSVVGVIAMTGIMTLSAVIYNLISDLVGGVEVVVLEETLNATYAAPTQPQRVRIPRRPSRGSPATSQRAASVPQAAAGAMQVPTSGPDA